MLQNGGEFRIYPLRVDFHCRVIFTCVTCVKFTFANKTEAMYERSHLSVKIEPRLTSRLISTLYILPLFYLGDLNLRALTCAAENPSVEINPKGDWRGRGQEPITPLAWLRVHLSPKWYLTLTQYGGIYLGISLRTTQNDTFMDRNNGFPSWFLNILSETELCNFYPKVRQRVSPSFSRGSLDPLPLGAKHHTKTWCGEDEEGRRGISWGQS